ncbi:hypothetical protein HY024_02955, partial [Candidatus Curtissbacteria bacterium]|nr:hypothetical protein [Candidatus Curtissbacteria bacterium]
FDLVGKDILSDKINIKNENDQKEPTLALAPENEKVIGASTSNLKAPSITAADLGITANDLSLNLNPSQLPKVIVPADSPLHPLVNAFFFFFKAISIDQTDRTKVEIEQLNLQLSESQDLKNRGKQAEAKNLVGKIQPQLNDIVKQNSIANNDIQTAVKSVSETRFSLLKEDLKEAKGEDRLKLIKQIGTEAKTTAEVVQPKLSQANTATSLNQRPIIGEAISSNNNSVKIKTAGGQEISIPKSDTAVKIRSKDSEQSQNDLSQIAPGTTVAMIGTTSENGDFKPSFILSNIPRQLSAPQPVTVLQVNPQNNSLFVLENGNPVKVQVTSQTSIKGSDTDVSLNSIKTGDVVVVHGDPVTPNKENGSVASPSISPSTNPSGLLTGTPKPGSPSKTPSPSSFTGSPLPGPNTGTKTTPTKPIVSPQNTTPQVVKSTSIQVIEKAKDAQQSKTSAPANNSNPSKQSSPPTSSNPSSNSTKKSDPKDDKKK